jgi:hypothetical protein
MKIVIFVSNMEERQAGTGFLEGTSESFAAFSMWKQSGKHDKDISMPFKDLGNITSSFRVEATNFEIKEHFPAKAQAAPRHDACRS